MIPTIYVPHTQRLAVTAQKARELLSGLSPKLLYHDTAHTFDPLLGVAAMANHYALLEKIPEASRELVVTAAYLHDTGYLEQYAKNEPIGARIAGEVLPALEYSRLEIITVQNLILDTDITLPPRDLLSEILRDADVDNLGRDDLFEKTDRLRRELGIESELQWNIGTAKFMENHRYFTISAQELRNGGKERNYRELTRLIQYGG